MEEIFTIIAEYGVGVAAIIVLLYNTRQMVSLQDRTIHLAEQLVESISITSKSMENLQDSVVRNMEHIESITDVLSVTIADVAHSQSHVVDRLKTLDDSIEQCKTVLSYALEELSKQVDLISEEIHDERKPD